jgi:hypothetical protein
MNNKDSSANLNRAKCVWNLSVLKFTDHPAWIRRESIDNPV